MLSESSCIPGFETMITVRPGSHVHRLITVLGLAGDTLSVRLAYWETSVLSERW